MMPLPNEPQAVRVVDRLLDKWAIEERTSLDITTIYRKIKAGTFPQPVRIGKRRVAWRESDVAEWLRTLEIGTSVVCRRTTVAAADTQQDATAPVFVGGRDRTAHSALRPTRPHPPRPTTR